MWHKAQAQLSQSGDGQPHQSGDVLAPFQTPLCHRVNEGPCTGHAMPKVGEAKKLGRPA
jgi:hypothetical protein